jgi:leader peptidase (prepilin peptidase)/N-methyltransferase
MFFDIFLFSIIISLFIFGTIIGSFLNVLINRYNTGRSISGRSFCPNCSAKIAWYDLIPVLSWFFLKKKCRHCRSKISVQYPLVEFSVGLLFVLLYYNFWPLTFINPQVFIIFYVWTAIIFLLLTIIFVYDFKHKIIPDKFSYAFAIMALIQTIVILPALQYQNQALFWLDLFSGLIFFLPFYLLWRFSDGKWIGLGDGKLAIGIGWFLGFIWAINAIILAFWLGAIFALILILIDKLKNKRSKINLKTAIPFGPFLILATILQFVFRFDFLGLNFFF